MSDYKQLHCVFCGNSFFPLLKTAGRPSKYCSSLCRNRASHQKAKEDGRIAKRYSENKEKRRIERLGMPQVCATCGKTFLDERKRKHCRNCTGIKKWVDLTWQHGFRRPPCKWCGKPCTWHGNVGFCSQECACADKVYQRKYELEKNKRLLTLGLIDYVAEEHLERKKREQLKRVLQMLRKLLRIRKRKEKAAKQVAKLKVCHWCGKTFVHSISRRRSWAYCSEECRKAVLQHRRRESRKTEAYKERKRSCGNNRKRARKYGCEYDSSIRATKVFERDGWHCRICGKRTPKRLQGKNKLNAPTLDHIIPLSKGGGHTWNNVQCACRLCNSVKSDRFIEPWLFPLQ